MEINYYLYQKSPAYNFSYPSSAIAVVFGVYLSARAAFRLDRKSPTIRLYVTSNVNLTNFKEDEIINKYNFYEN